MDHPRPLFNLFSVIPNYTILKGGSPGLVVKGKPEGYEFEVHPTARIDTNKEKENYQVF